jgi:hypothetical protein
MTRSGRTTLLFAAIMGGAAVILAARPLGLALSETVLEWTSALGKLPFLLVAVIYAWRNARRFEAGNPARLGWLLLFAGWLSFTFAQSSLCVYELYLGVAVPFPSVADVFFLLGYPLLIASLFAFLRSYAAAGFPIGGAGERWMLAAATLLACALLGVPILRPIVAAPAPALEKFLNVVYPILDFVLLVPTVLLLRVTVRFRGGAVWKTWLALLGGVIFTFAGDSVFAYLQALGENRFLRLVDILYVLSFGWIARGVLYQHEMLSD